MLPTLEEYVPTSTVLLIALYLLASSAPTWRYPAGALTRAWASRRAPTWRHASHQLCTRGRARSMRWRSAGGSVVVRRWRWSVAPKGSKRFQRRRDRRRDRRLWRRLARAAEAVAGRPVGWPLPWECRAAQGRQVRPEEAQEPSWGTLLPRLYVDHDAVRTRRSAPPPA